MDPSPPPQRSPSIGQLLQATPLTWLLIASCIAVALGSSFGDDRRVLAWLTLADPRRLGDTVASGFAGIANGEIWRLVTPILIHFGAIHLIFNLLWLKDLGGAIELVRSTRTLAGLVLVSGVLSNIAQYVVNWDYATGLRFGNVLSGGMSGVVYALLGYAWLLGRREPQRGIRISGQTLVFMLAWLVLCTTGMLGPIGNMAHASGLVIGLAWGWLGTGRDRGVDARDV